MRPGNQLKREREHRGWSQAKVAELVGTNTHTVGRWERGVSLPYPIYRERLCQLFEKDVHALGLIEYDTTLSRQEQQNSMAPPTDSSHSTSSFLFDAALPIPSPEARTLIGRHTLLTQLKEQVCVGFATCALYGLPGVGKTSLALTLAYDPELRERFCDGVLWVGLGINPSVQELLSRWGTLLGLTTSEMTSIKDTMEWARMLRALIGMRHMLLIIDDAWTIEDAQSFQIGGPNCACIVTTRFPQIGLQIAADKITVVSELKEEDGITLLASFVPKLVEQDVTTAQRLVQAVGSLPLALVLIGKYLRAHAYSEQPRRLRKAIDHVSNAGQRLQLSEPIGAARPSPSQAGGTSFSLQSVIALSDDYLDEPARMMLRTLSVFPSKPNSFTEEAAVTISGLATETLDRLCDAGLLESCGAGRYMLHQTIADYARAQLTGHESLIYQRMVDYLVRYIEVHETDYDALAREYQNIMTALQEAFDRDMQAEFIRGTVAFASFLRLRGLHDQAHEQLQRAYQLASPLEDRTHTITILNHLGQCARLQGHYVQAEAFLLEGLHLARRLGLSESICPFLIYLGRTVDKLGDYARAETYLQEGLTLARQFNQQEYLCTALTTFGDLAMLQGHYEQAASALQEGLILARRLQQKEQMITMLTTLGAIALHKENYALARAYLQEGLDLARPLGYRLGISRLLINMSEMALSTGDYSQAEQYLQEGLTQAYQLCNWVYIGFMRNNLGKLASLQGNPIQANIYFQEGLEIARQINYPWLICAFLCEWGEAYLLDHRLDEALARFTEVLTQAPKELEDKIAMAHYGIARILLEQGKIDEARQHCEISLASFEAIGLPKAAAARQLLEQFVTRYEQQCN